VPGLAIKEPVMAEERDRMDQSDPMNQPDRGIDTDSRDRQSDISSSVPPSDVDADIDEDEDEDELPDG
jgi:hypothetical protein